MAKLAKAVFEKENDNTLTFVFDDKIYDGDVFYLDDLDVLESTHQRDMFNPPWEVYRFWPGQVRSEGYIKNIVIDKSFSEYKPKDMTGWFAENERLKEIVGLENLDTSECVSFNHLFAECPLLKRVDVSGFDTSKVVDFNHMFANCISLRNLDAAEKFDTSSAKTMSCMFCGTKITHLNLAGWDVSGVEDMSGLFASCTRLFRVDGLDKWDTSSCKNFSFMFEGDIYLRSVDVSGFNTFEAVETFNFFKNCRSMRDIDLSGWTVDFVITKAGNRKAKLRDMTEFFAGCDKLESVKLSPQFHKFFNHGGVIYSSKLPYRVKVEPELRPSDYCNREYIAIIDDKAHTLKFDFARHKSFDDKYRIEDGHNLDKRDLAYFGAHPTSVRFSGNVDRLVPEYKKSSLANLEREARVSGAAAEHIIEPEKNKKDRFSDLTA